MTPPVVLELEQLVAGQLPARPVDAIGFSIGAGVLLRLAAAEPGRFRRIVTLGVGVNLFRAEGSDLLLRAIEGTGDPADPVTRYFDRLARHPETDRAALAAYLRCPRPPLTPAELATVTARVLVVIGDRDFAGPGEPLADALPEAKLVTQAGRFLSR